MSTPPASAVSTTPAPRRTSPTRFLLSTAALGAAGGILVVAINLSLLAVPLSSLSYSIYSATLGIWFLGPLVATALFRRPGVAILTSVFAGIVNFVTPFGFAQFANFLIAGVILELPFAIMLYRRWSDRMIKTAFPIALVAASGVYLLACLLADVIRFSEWVPWLAIGTVVVTVALAFGLTSLSMSIAAKLRRAGVGGPLAMQSNSAPTPDPATTPPAA